MRPSIGRIVHFHFDDAGVVRSAPAIVTEVFGETTVNLQVFLDGTNAYDRQRPDGANAFSKAECERGLAWRTSIEEGPGSHEWSWPPRV